MAKEMPRKPEEMAEVKPVPGVDCDLEIKLVLTPDEVKRLGKMWGMADPASVEGQIRAWITEDLEVMNARDRLVNSLTYQIAALDAEKLAQVAEIMK